MLDVVRHSLLEEALERNDMLVGYTVDQYHAFIAGGLIPESVRTELIDGLLVQKDRAKAGEDPMTIGDRHRYVVSKLAQLAPRFEAFGCFLQTQQPVMLPPKNEPEPDVSVIRGTIDDFRDHPPQAADTIFVLEVADSSLRRDLTVKLPIYARASIPEYILVNLQENVVLVHRLPQGDRYAEVVALGMTDTLAMKTARANLVETQIAELMR